jgi:hypothetical protein
MPKRGATGRKCTKLDFYLYDDKNLKITIKKTNYRHNKI